jgi:hypothetical protein
MVGKMESQGTHNWGKRNQERHERIVEWSTVVFILAIAASVSYHWLHAKTDSVTPSPADRYKDADRVETYKLGEHLVLTDSAAGLAALIRHCKDTRLMYENVTFSGMDTNGAEHPFCEDGFLSEQEAKELRPEYRGPP